MAGVYELVILLYVKQDILVRVGFCKLRSVCSYVDVRHRCQNVTEAVPLELVELIGNAAHARLVPLAVSIVLFDVAVQLDGELLQIVGLVLYLLALLTSLLHAVFLTC